MRYRYITCGSCKPSDPICNFRLISHRVIGGVQELAGSVYLRVQIPDDLELEKYACDEYSTTTDTRTIEDLGYNYVVTMWDGKRKVIPASVEPRGFASAQFAEWLNHLYG